MDRRWLSTGSRWVVLTALGWILVGCSAVASRPAFDCGSVPSAACQAATVAARNSLPRAVVPRQLVGATVRLIDPTDPVLCRDYGVCEAARWAAIVELTVPGVDGISESYPVAVIQRQAGDPIIAPKPYPPYPGASEAP